MFVFIVVVMCRCLIVGCRCGMCVVVFCFFCVVFDVVCCLLVFDCRARFVGLMVWFVCFIVWCRVMLFVEYFCQLRFVLYCS